MGRVSQGMNPLGRPRSTEEALKSEYRTIVDAEYGLQQRRSTGCQQAVVVRFRRCKLHLRGESVALRAPAHRQLCAVQFADTLGDGHTQTAAVAFAAGHTVKPLAFFYALEVIRGVIASSVLSADAVGKPRSGADG